MELDINLKSEYDYDKQFVETPQGKAVLIILALLSLFCLSLAFYNSYLIVKKDLLKS